MAEQPRPENAPVIQGATDYSALAGQYVRHAENSAYNAYYERPAIQTLAGDVRGLRVLDAGCAGGAHSQWLVEHGAIVTSIDASADMVGITQERLGDKVRALQADLGQPLPFSNQEFDLVFSSLTLHYVEDWSIPLGEFHRILRPGGILVLSTHHPYVDRRLVSADNYFETGLVEEVWTLNNEDQVTMRFYRKTLAGIVNSIAAAGFSLQRLEEPAPSQELLDRYPDDFRRLKQQPGFLLIRAQKD